MNAEIELYELLRIKMGELNAKKVIDYMETKVSKTTLEEKLGQLATKVDLEKTKTGLVKWMFIFWVSQLAVWVSFSHFLPR